MDGIRRDATLRRLRWVKGGLAAAMAALTLLLANAAASAFPGHTRQASRTTAASTAPTAPRHRSSRTLTAPQSAPTTSTGSATVTSGGS